MVVLHRAGGFRHRAENPCCNGEHEGWRQTCVHATGMTMKKRLRRSFKAVAEWCRTHRHDAVDKQQAILNAKLRGHYQYYGRPTNYRSLWQFYRGVRQTWKKWLERRSRGQPLSWERYAQILRRHPLLRPQITHTWTRAVSQP